MRVLWKMIDGADFLYCPHQQSEAERELAAPATCPVSSHAGAKIKCCVFKVEESGANWCEFFNVDHNEMKMV